MPLKKYNNAKRREKNGGDFEILGVIFVIISAFLLLCIVIPIALGPVSQAIRNVVIGLFGFFAYPIFLSTLILGVALIQDRKISMPTRYVVCIAVIAVFLMLILQLATTHKFLNLSFSEYISNAYSNHNAGGIIFGVIAFPIQKAITPIVSYILFSVAVVATGAFMAYSLYKRLRSPKEKNVVDIMQEKPKMQFVKGSNSPMPVKSVSDTSLFVATIKPKQNIQAQSGSFTELNPQINTLGESKYSQKPKTDYEFHSYHDTSIENKSGEYKSQAHEILFGDKSLYHQSLLSASQSKSSSDSEKYLSGFNLPPSLSAAPDIKDRTSEEKPVKPPKIVHLEDIPSLHKIPNPPPKDFTDLVVGGTIINGDDLSRQIAEEKIEKEIQSPENIKPTFDLRKIEPMSLKPNKNKFEVPILPDPINLDEEKVIQSPIIQGDYFGMPLKKEEPVTYKPSTIAPIINSTKINPVYDEQEDYPLMPIEKADSFIPDAETRFAKLLEAEKSIKENTSSIPKGLGSFNFEDGGDLSETSFDVEQDHTGMYNMVDDSQQSFENKVLELDKNLNREKREPIRIEPPQIIRANSQLKIDEIIPSTPLPAQKPKKKHLGNYVPPPIDLLDINEVKLPEDFTEESSNSARLLEETLKGLKLPATVNAITRGPAVTRYELEMPPGIPIKRIETYSTDIEYYLAANGKIRIETPIPGKRAVGIEVPNAKIDIVGLRDIIDSKDFKSSTSPVTLALGKDIAGQCIVCNLEKMPHLLIAGATGSGKSACLNSIIISILYKSSPEDVRIMLIDPKHVEFTIYRDLPHLLTKEIITDAQQAINAFKWAREEMERRYLLFSKHYVRNLQEYNKSDVVKNGEESKLPYIVLIVDELAELMMSNNRKELEDKIMSMAQKARAAGIHLILATQRPSVDVITGTIKANLPSRIAFSVKSIVDSRTILDQCGAETLLGRGDMLYAPLGFDDPRRVQGAYVTNEEVSTIVSFVKENNQCDYDDDIEQAITVKEEISVADDDGEEESEFDALMPSVLKCVIDSGQASTSMIQRRFSVGYARASRIIDQMELHKFIGPLEGSKPRAVYISREQYRELFGEEI